MICREIIKEIEARFPKHYAMEWDNVGLQVGRSDKRSSRLGRRYADHTSSDDL